MIGPTIFRSRRRPRARPRKANPSNTPSSQPVTRNTPSEVEGQPARRKAQEKD